ncbi:MAG TPA: SBBP repeat-containing protein [Terriglobales bacterium]
MKLRTRFSLLAILFICSQFMIAAETPRADHKPVATTALAKLPMSFEPAQTAGRFVASGGAYRVSIGANDSYIAINKGGPASSAILHFAFENANPNASLQGIKPLPGVINYYLGQDSKNWRLGVKPYEKVQANSVYPGIDVAYYGDHRQLEFDFVVAPGADPKAIALKIDGADKLSLSSEGDLVAATNETEFRLHKPFAYQLKQGKQIPVAVEYVLNGTNNATLHLGNYDKSRELVIDPKLTYSTFLGGSQADSGNGIATDATGNAYIVGKSCSTDFIGGTGFKGTTGSCDAYVTKLDPTGQTVLWTTFIAGAAPVPNPATASANGVALDATGNVYVVGTTNFVVLPLRATPGTAPAHCTCYSGGDSDAFISILTNGGALIRETYLGGSNIDQGFGITVDQKQNVSVVGQTCSSDFPAYNSIEAKVEACVAFITKLDFGLHIAGPILPGASPVSPRPASLTDTNCSTGALCPATPDATQTYYFFSTLFGGQLLPPESSFPVVQGIYVPGLPVPPGAITIATPNCNPSDVPQVLLAENSSLTKTSGGLIWPCPTVKLKSTVLDTGADRTANTADDFVWLDLGPAPPSVPFAFTEAYGVALDPVADVFAVGGTITDDLTPYLNYAGYAGINFGKTGAWVLKLDGLNGDQIWATALTTNPDTDAAPNSARAIAVDTSGQSFITGVSSGTLITTPGAANPALIGGKDAFVIKLDIPASHFLYGTYLGGKGDDQGLAIAIDNGGAAYVAGNTTSTDLKVINPVQDSAGTPETSLLGPQDALIARVNPSGSALTMMAYLGGASAESGNGIALDLSGNIFVAGTTQSVDFPIVPTAAATPGKTVYGGGQSDAFVTLINGASFPLASVSPATLNFGSQNLGTTSAAQTATLRNTGSGILNISTISFAGTGGDYFQTNDCGSQLTPAGGAKDTCTITVTFTPSAVGSRPDVIQIADDSANSPQTIAVAGIGTSVQGSMQLSVATLDFGNQAVGTTSTPKTVTLTNISSSLPITISTITATSPFKQTNNCPVAPATLAGGANCTIQVTFAPTTNANANGTLTVSGQAQNSPQSVTLTGIGGTGGGTPLPPGAPDFTLTSSQPTITIPSSGGTATFQASAAPLNGFNQAVTLNCAAPSGASCSLSPSSLQVSGSSPASSTVTVTIAQTSTGTGPRSAELMHGSRPFFASILPFGVLGMVAIGRKRRTKLLVLLVLLGTVLFSVNCGGSGGSTQGMAPGNYQVTVTAATSGSSAITHSTVITLTVN